MGSIGTSVAVVVVLVVSVASAELVNSPPADGFVVVDSSGSVVGRPTSVTDTWTEALIGLRDTNGDPDADHWFSIPLIWSQGATPIDVSYDFRRSDASYYYTGPNCTGATSVHLGSALGSNIVLLQGNDIGYVVTTAPGGPLTFISVSFSGGPCQSVNPPIVGAQIVLTPILDVGVWSPPFRIVRDGDLVLPPSVATLGEVAVAIAIGAFVATHWWSRKRVVG